MNFNKKSIYTSYYINDEKYSHWQLIDSNNYDSNLDECSTDNHNGQFYRKNCNSKFRCCNRCCNRGCNRCCNRCCIPECCYEECQMKKQCHLAQCQKNGDVSQKQGDQTQSQGDLLVTQGDLSQTQGDQTESQGDLLATQGDLSQTQGDQTESQGDLLATQGDLSQTQGDQTESQGDLSVSQGDLIESLGDISQYQGGQTQGDQTETMTGQGGQTQGDQTQTMTGHGGQTLGDQTLLNNPSISTPVNVSGVNVNLTVSCCDDNKKHHKDCHNNCQEECRKSITTLLTLLKTFSLTIADPSSSLITFYNCGSQSSSTIGTLGNVTECIFSVIPESGGNEITFLTDSLVALSFESVITTPNLFSLLLAYLQSLPTICTCDDSDETCNCVCCSKKVELLIQAYYLAKVQLRINLACVSFTGYIYKICNGIIYLVDILTNPTIIYAIPVCKILSYQPQ